MRWPKFASHILIKYYISKTNPNEAYVVVNSAGEVCRMIFFLKLY